MFTALAIRQICLLPRTCSSGRFRRSRHVQIMARTCDTPILARSRLSGRFHVGTASPRPQTNRTTSRPGRHGIPPRITLRGGVAQQASPSDTPRCTNACSGILRGLGNSADEILAVARLHLSDAEAEQLTAATDRRPDTARTFGWPPSYSACTRTPAGEPSHLCAELVDASGRIARNRFEGLRAGATNPSGDGPPAPRSDRALRRGAGRAGADGPGREAPLPGGAAGAHRALRRTWRARHRDRPAP